MRQNVLTNSTVILFGGSFDPLHLGHIQVVEKIHTNFPEAQIIVLPSQNRLKDQSLIPLEKRIELTQIGFKDFSFVTVVDWSLHWNTSSTYEVVEKMKKDYFPGSKIVVCSGEDILPSLPKWLYFEKLKKISWILFTRHQGKLISQYEKDSTYFPLFKNATIVKDTILTISSTELKKDPTLFEKYIPNSIKPQVKNYLKF